MAATTQAKRVLELVRQKGIVRGTELDRLGIHRMHLKRLVDRGLLVQRSRGVYEGAEPRMSEHDSVIEVAARVPKATICLLTALRLHRLTTQNPFEVWMMIDRKARKPSITYPPIRVVRASGPALTEGVVAMKLNGVDINVTTVAKTTVPDIAWPRCAEHPRVSSGDERRREG
jgi:predicted transcriptional regulator of viral defense system